MLQAGRLPFIEYGAEAALKKALLESRLVFSLSSEGVSKGKPVIITIGTPIDEFLNPVRKVVQDCIDDILPFVANGQLVVLRSTVFPGTTDWLQSYLQSRGRDILVAYCPERITQGSGLKELYELPQIISGTTPEAERGGGVIRSR
jgi:UDP-N-acetyl-D-mannosaminuronic acid dehydrogenase